MTDTFLTNTSGYLSSLEYERVITLMEHQQDALIAIIAILGAMLGTALFRHLRK